MSTVIKNKKFLETKMKKGPEPGARGKEQFPEFKCN